MKQFKNLLAIIVLLLVIVVIVGGFLYLKNNPNLFSTPSLPSLGSQPTLDITKVYQFTPTFGPQDVDHLVATVMPTPRAVLTEPEVAAMNEALKDKNRLLGTDYVVGSQYSAMGVSWYCTDIKLGEWSLPGSNIGVAKLIEGTWGMEASLSEVSFTMEKGSTTTPVYHKADANGNPYIETKYNGVLVVTIESFGIDGPTYLEGNEWVFSVGKPIPGYELWLIPRQIITGQSLLEEKRVEVVNMAERRVKLETIAPNGSNDILLGLYDQFKSSFTKEGDKYIYNTLVTLLEPLARENGYAGIEAVRLIIPDAPKTIYGWMDMNGMPLIPSDYPSVFADSTCPQAQPSPADIERFTNED